MKSGAKIIAEYVKTLPANPGVYRMIDKNGRVLYVGKAKSLKKRVSSYTKYDKHSTRIKRVIAATRSMEFVITNSETEALLLEARLIKKLKPRYNILLRDDKSFPYILLRDDHKAPQLQKHRGARKISGKYYGPFASAGAVNRTLDTLQRTFLLRTCSDSVYNSRSRPCMLYQIKRCSAPCTDEISAEDYNRLVSDADDFLSGRSEKLRKRLQAQMQNASKSLDFEKAAEIRDRLKSLAIISSGKTSLNPKTFNEADIASITINGGQACVQVFFFRSGQNWGANAYFPKTDKFTDKLTGKAEVLEAFLAQFYLNKPIPKALFVNVKMPNQQILQQALAERREKSFKIIIPKKGEKKRLIDLALTNAEQALARRQSETKSIRKLHKELKEALGLTAIPERIEVYDNSHISGTNAVGAFIVAGLGGFERREYRTFNIKDKNIIAGDDYAMMGEIIRRRFGRLLENNNMVWPDLVIIDGGKGQLSTVQNILDEIGASNRFSLIAIAKGKDRNAGNETFHMIGREPFSLTAKSPLLYYLQKLRDEAHRFAIGTHKTRRKKQMQKNPLDAIEGIGAKRKKQLLHWFGSAKAVSMASKEDLAMVDGVSKRLAGVIYDYFNE